MEEREEWPTGEEARLPITEEPASGVNGPLGAVRDAAFLVAFGRQSEPSFEELKRSKNETRSCFVLVVRARVRLFIEY